MGARGPKPWEPTEEERKRIRLYSGLGMTQEQVATLVGKSVDSLAKRCRDELDGGKAETIAKVAGTLVQKALSGDTTSAIFYLKTQAGWKETSVLEHAGKVKHSYDLDSLSDGQLEQLEAILSAATERGPSAGSVGEAEPSSVH